MKGQTTGYGMYIAIGLGVIAIAIIILFPIIRGILNDADNTRPTIPTSSIQQENTSFKIVV
jgi:hypothetical protein